jgi:hypothetical protein
MNSRILPALALMIAIGIFFVYVNPTWSGTIAATKAALALDTQTLAAADEYTAQQNKLVAARAAIDPADTARLEIFLPDSVDNVGIILNLNALAARSGLSLANIDVAAVDASQAQAATGALPGATNPIGSVNLSLAAVGTYSALHSFLAGVERSARLLDAQDIVVKGSDTGVYTYSMSLRLYWLR